MADLKRVYTAATEEIALVELDAFEEKWYSKYPKIAKSWRDNRANLSAYFKYPEAIPFQHLSTENISTTKKAHKTGLFS